MVRGDKRDGEITQLHTSMIDKIDKKISKATEFSKEFIHFQSETIGNARDQIAMYLKAAYDVT